MILMSEILLLRIWRIVGIVVAVNGLFVVVNQCVLYYYQLLM